MFYSIVIVAALVACLVRCVAVFLDTREAQAEREDSPEDEIEQRRRWL